MTYIDDAQRRIDEERARWQQKKAEDQARKEQEEKAKKQAAEQAKKESSTLW